MTTTRFENIPEALRLRPQWVCSRMPDKIPVTPSGKPASSTDSSTWSTFEVCRDAAARRGWGIGFVFTDVDPFAVIDLDHVRNAETGDTEPWALELIDELASYTELSWSGSGWHIIVLGKLPGRGNKRGRVEVYDHAKVVTLTGQTLLGFGSDTIAARDLEGFQARLLEGKLDPTASTPKAAAQCRTGDKSKDDWALVAAVQKIKNTRSAEELDKAVQAAYPAIYTERNRGVGA